MDSFFVKKAKGDIEKSLTNEVLNYNIVEKYPNLETKALGTRYKIDNHCHEVENMDRKADFEINLQRKGVSGRHCSRSNRE